MLLLLLAYSVRLLQLQLVHLFLIFQQLLLKARARLSLLLRRSRKSRCLQSQQVCHLLRMFGFQERDLLSLQRSALILKSLHHLSTLGFVPCRSINFIVDVRRARKLRVEGFVRVLGRCPIAVRSILVREIRHQLIFDMEPVRLCETI
jgi:hypothetical protein